MFEFRYIWPPRPKTAVTIDQVPFYQKRGWLAQYKKNGSYALIYIFPGRPIEFWNRHEAKHKWDPPAETTQFLQSFSDRPIVLAAELLHNKHPGYRDILYIHDVLVLGDYLVGTPLPFRQRILCELFNTDGATEEYSHWAVTNKIWVAKTFDSGFSDIISHIKDPKLDEGIVLKNPKATLQNSTAKDTNAAWQVKCRFPTKNYGF